jgi:hypothetical protein
LKNENNDPETASEKVVEHPRLKRDRAFALYKARCYAHNHGLPMPDPASIGPAVFVKIGPDMSRDQKVEALLSAFKKRGIKVDMDK